MQRLEVSCAVRSMYTSLGAKGLKVTDQSKVGCCLMNTVCSTKKLYLKKDNEK